MIKRFFIKDLTSNRYYAGYNANRDRWFVKNIKTAKYFDVKSEAKSLITGNHFADEPKFKDSIFQIITVYY